MVSPPAAGPFDPAREFERVVAAQSAGFKVEAAADKPQLRIDKDNMTFKVKTEKEGYVYVLQYGTDGGIVQVFPNTAAKSNRLKADSTTSLPPKNALTIAGGPPGIDHLLVIVSNHPRAVQGARPEERATASSRRRSMRRAQAAEAAGPAASVFAGTPVCTQPCSDEYGAAVFTVEEIR